MPDASSEQIAAPGTPSTFYMCELPASSVKATSPQGLDSLPAQPRRTARTLEPSCIAHDLQSEEVVHPGTNVPCLAPCLQASEAFTEDPDEAGGVTMMEDGVPAQRKDSKVMESAFAAKTADAEPQAPHARQRQDQPHRAKVQPDRLRRRWRHLHASERTRITMHSHRDGQPLQG